MARKPNVPMDACIERQNQLFCRQNTIRPLNREKTVCQRKTKLFVTEEDIKTVQKAKF